MGTNQEEKRMNTAKEGKMRYFQFAYDAILPTTNEQFRGGLTIECNHFPSQKELKTLLCDGRVDDLKGQTENINISFPSIFEFKDKKDFDSWCSGEYR